MPIEEKTRTADLRQYVAEAVLGLTGRLLSENTARARFGSNLQIVVGIFLLVFGYWIGREHCHLVLFGVKSQGKLVGYQEQRFPSGSGGVSWDSASMPIIEFQAVAR